MDGWGTAAKKTGLNLHVSGLPSLCHFNFVDDHELILTTLFTQIMLEKGYLAYNQFKPSFAHTKEHVDSYLAAVEEAFTSLAEALAHGNPGSLLKGPIAQRGFYRLA